METETRTIGIGRPGSMVYALLIVPKQVAEEKASSKDNRRIPSKPAIVVAG